MKKTALPEAINILCQRCRKKCKQPAYMKLIKCPHFESMEIQMEIPLNPRGRPRKKKA